MTYNILDGGEDRFDKLLAVMREADPNIIALQEANDEEILDNLGRELEMQAVLVEGNRGYNLGLLSRYPISEVESPLDPAIFHHGYLQAKLDTPLGPVKALVAHLKPGYSPADEEFRQREVAAILAAMQPDFEGLSFLAGDFNTMSPQDVMKLEDWPLHWRVYLATLGGDIGRAAITEVLAAGYTDSYRQLYPPADPNAPEKSRYQPGYTLPAYKPNIRLDYLFTSPRLATHLQSCEVFSSSQAKAASDHLPLVADFG